VPNKSASCDIRQRRWFHDIWFEFDAGYLVFGQLLLPVCAFGSYNKHLDKFPNVAAATEHQTDPDIHL